MFASRTNWDLSLNRFTGAVQSHLRAGRSLLDLTASNPTSADFTYDSKVILASLSDEAAMRYDPQPLGLESAREAVARHYAQRSPGGVQLSPARILLTTSTSEAYAFTFRLLCEPGNEVLAPRPSYPLLEYLAAIEDVRLVPYALIYDHGWQIDFGSVARGLTPKTKAILVIHPNNPTGSYVKEHELDQLNRMCGEKQIAIIADEVFLDFANPALRSSGGEAHKSPLPPSPDFSFSQNIAALTFTFSGLSKISGLPQMKVAWMVVCGPAIAASHAMERLEIISDTYLSMNAPLQLALPALLEQRHAFQEQVKERIAKNLGNLDSQLASQKNRLCTRLAVEGGWYGVLRVPATGSDENLAIELLRQKSVLVHPGHFYDFDREGYLVVSLITPPDDFSEGLQRVLDYIASPSDG